MKEKEHKTFETDNFPLATLLLTEGCKLLSINKANPRRAVFVFEDSDERKSLTNAFWMWEATTEPRQFFAGQKELKSMIFSSSYSVQQGNGD